MASDGPCSATRCPYLVSVRLWGHWQGWWRLGKGSRVWRHGVRHEPWRSTRNCAITFKASSLSTKDRSLDSRIPETEMRGAGQHGYADHPTGISGRLL